MTHFVCGIIVPKEEFENIESYISETLEKYSEEYEVEPYIEKTKEELIKKFEEWKERMNDKINNNTKLENYELDYIKDGKLKDISLKEWLKSWCSYDNFDKDGNLLSTSNPNSFYDWYGIGGRWSGLFYGKEPKDSGNQELKDNIISIKDLIRKYKKAEGNTKEKIIKALSEEQKNNPFLIHIVVADGKVYQARGYGWFGTYKQEVEEDKWKEKYLKLLEKHKDDFMVNLDVHI